MKSMQSGEGNSKDSRGKYHIKTFGCQMNVADSERMEALLRDYGMESCETPEQADVIVVNGCSVREKPVHKAISALGTYQSFKSGSTRKNPKGPIIALGGCVGQLEKDRLFKKAPYLDFVFGPDAIDELPEMIDLAKRGERHFVNVEFDRKRSYSTETRIHRRKAQAFVNIMKGCDKFCTYCIVPFTRGREKSRTIDEVVDDVASLVAQGVREITLLGQNVNSFGKGNENVKNRKPLQLSNIIGPVGPKPGQENFPQLLRAIDEDPRCASLKRIRFTSSHPLDFSDELIDCYASQEDGGVQRLAKQLHLPVQSGSNRILRKMGRHHQVENYVDQMERLKTLCPEVGLMTDLIVGFPTETEEDFEQTLKLLDRLEYDQVFAFAYSPRPGTRAAKLEDDVPEAVKRRRLNQLIDHQKKISERINQRRVGQSLEVLVEGLSKSQHILEKKLEKKKDSEQSRSTHSQSRVWQGRTECGRIVNFIADVPRDLTGRFEQVEILEGSALALSGILKVQIGEPLGAAL